MTAKNENEAWPPPIKPDDAAFTRIEEGKTVLGTGAIETKGE